MKLARLALRLIYTSALIMIGAIAISVMTRDAWLRVGHVAGALSAVIAAGAALVLGVAGLRGVARGLPGTPRHPQILEPHEQGLTGLEAAQAFAPSCSAQGPSGPRPGLDRADVPTPRR